MLKWMNILMIVLLIGLSGCKYKEDEDINSTKAPIPLNVQMQVIGSHIEGMTVCFNNDICKKTDIKGMVAFEKIGSYSFKIKDMNISTINIEQNKTIITPYVLFEKDDILAKNTALLIHAFDKDSDPTDQSVLLSFSSYIPKANNITTFISEQRIDDNLTFLINEHNNTIDFNSSKIYRDCKDENMSIFDENTSAFVTSLVFHCDEFLLDIPSKDAYATLADVTAFIALAENKNIRLENIETTYILRQETLTSFMLGESYRFSFFAEKEKVIVEIFDTQTGTTDKAELLENDDENTLLSNLTQLTIVK